MDINKINVVKELHQQLEERKKLALTCIATAYHEDESISISYNDRDKWLYAEWTGYQTEGSIRKGFEKILEALILHRTTKVLNDNRKVIGIWTPAAIWVGSNWFPRIISNGLLHFAWVYSPKVFSQFSTDESIKNTSPEEVLEIIKTFHDILLAEEWLNSIA